MEAKLEMCGRWHYINLDDDNGQNWRELGDFLARNTEEEMAYEIGSRMSWLLMLGQCLQHLGVDDPETQHAAWIAERELTVRALRDVCADYGDNDWPDTLNLSDVVEKHLHRNLGG